METPDVPVGWAAVFFTPDDEVMAALPNVDDDEDIEQFTPTWWATMCMMLRRVENQDILMQLEQRLLEEIGKNEESDGE